MNIPIIYEDNHLLVIEKPVNMPVQEDRSKDKDVLTALKEMIKVRDRKPGNVFLALVHRLDRPVGGVMVFAKTSKAASRLSDVLRRNDMTRKYLVVARGKPKEKNKKLVHYLLKDRRHNFVNVVQQGTKRAQKAILKYETVETLDDLSLLTVKLHTGRPHQIRVQLSKVGLPIVGDQKYGIEKRPGQQIALWAQELSFPHPTTKERLTFTAQPPREYPWNIWPSLYR